MGGKGQIKTRTNRAPYCKGEKPQALGNFDLYAERGRGEEGKERSSAREADCTGHGRRDQTDSLRGFDQDIGNKVYHGPGIASTKKETGGIRPLGFVVCDGFRRRVKTKKREKERGWGGKGLTRRRLVGALA